MSREDIPACVRWEILMHERFSRVWICKDFGRATTGADPTELGRTVLAAYLAGRPTQGETFRVVVRTDDDSRHVSLPANSRAPAGKRIRPSARHYPPTCATP
ncbi:hypothetical protein [Streptomyces canarius]|uniref:hypothetical protein n=1 Tax=Streptomyces canarius TaxID=285453 RepID=UPI001E58FAB7|nr:hypothetical protein [Streptomyces canarius]